MMHMLWLSGGDVTGKRKNSVVVKIRDVVVMYIALISCGKVLASKIPQSRWFESGFFQRGSSGAVSPKEIYENK